MTTTLSPGKWRGLMTTATASQTFAILAFDQRGNYRQLLPEDATFADAVQIKQQVVSALSPHASAVLLDPVYGLGAAQHMAGSSGLLMAIEKTGYSGKATARRVDFIEGWDVGKIKQMGASAAKVLVYYHPDAGEATQHIEDVVRELAAQCRQHDITFFVEPVTYSPDEALPKDSPEFASQRPEIIQETVRRLGEAGADVLKIEFPIDVKYETNHDVWRAACEAVSDACPVPWALLSAGVDFDVFLQQVQVACEGGASGFVGGRAIWKDAIPLDEAARTEFLASVAVERLKKLRAVVEKDGKPWTDFYTPIPTVEAWFHQYT
ncbi:tagatose 1,6-diphosphate aldolase [Phototrophicus methaneseepsis]|uniref:Tagatose 1,6-diphosphate aldolase n=1 Tax=Phototrophicus methaneseepsis TaxID=2710758 RepID=A0A7S8IFD4_9CHLR|nr:tagatose 1,6-diphosphate aldolase [Phototrophicus methaneseepsis]QPC83384.1 tagatose 1,6-diphosphate aldolase [Phototrophicus methaneseepsis]